MLGNELLNLSDVVTRNAERSPESKALILCDGDITYARLEELVWQNAQYLFSCGVRPGETVAQIYNSQPKELILTLAAARLGAVTLSLSKNWTEQRKTAAIEYSGAGYLVSDIPELDYKGLRKIVVESDVTARPVNSYEMSICAREPSAPWIIASSSGSTGNPKWFSLSHRNFLDRMSRRIAAFAITEEDVFARLPAIAFLGSKFRYFTQLAAGGKILFCDYGREGVIQACRKYGVTVLSGVAVQIDTILKGVSGGKSPLPDLRVLELSGSLISETLREKIERALTSNIYITYSSNEFGSSNVAMPDDVRKYPGTVGKTLPDVELQITDTSGGILPSGQVGHIRMRTENMIDHYLEPKESSAFRNGWYYPGDLGKLIKSGQLIHYGRADDLMIMNGINVYPAELENCLKGHPAVKDAIALPIKHPVHQDIPIALVSLETDETVAEEKLLSYAKSRLGIHSPKKILIVSKLPRNDMGKIDRAKVDKVVNSRLGVRQIDETEDTRISGAQERLLMQTQIFLNVRFAYPGNIDFELIDNWLNFFVDRDNGKDYFRVTDTTNIKAGDEPLMWLTLSLLFTRYLLQMSRLPVFSQPQILAISESAEIPGEFEAAVSMARVDGLPIQVYSQTLQHSFKALSWAGKNETSPINREKLFGELQREIISRLTGKFVPGKSAFPVLKCACDLGIPFRHLAAGIFQLGWGSKSRLLERSTTGGDPAMAAKLTKNKYDTARVLKAAGLPTPHQFLVNSEDMAAESAAKIGWPVVLKPADRERGEGVTVDIYSDQELKNAFAKAREISTSNSLLVEKQINGTCHRLFVAHGKLLYGVKRLPLSITADGIHSIASILEQELKDQMLRPPWSRSELKPLDDLAVNAINSAGYAPESIPDSGVVIPLRRIESTAWGGIDEDVTDAVHYENVAIAVRSATVLGLNVAGVDIMSEEISVPWYENDAAINEVNFAPLLGGGEISRSRIPQFLNDYLEGRGRIPIDVYVGGEDAWSKAKTVCESETKRSLFVTDGNETLCCPGSWIHLSTRSLYQSVRSLVLWREVDALRIVVRTDEFLKTGLPLEFVDSIHFIDERLTSVDNGKIISQNRYLQLVAKLRHWSSEGNS